MKAIGRKDNALPMMDGPNLPAAIIRAEPTQGVKAANPGNGVLELVINFIPLFALR
jgi:hypothetical protein